MSFDTEADIFADAADLRAKQQRSERLASARDLAAMSQSPVESNQPQQSFSPEAAPQEKTFGEKAADVAKDVGFGILETPEALLNAAREEIFDAVSVVNDLGDFLDEAQKSAGIPEIGNEFARNNRRAMLELVSGFNEKDESTVTGTMVREMANIGFAYFGISKKLKGAKWVKALASGTSEKVALNVSNAVAGAAADFLTIDTAEQDLNSLLEEYPVLRNPVTEYLAGDMDELALKKRLRGAVGGAMAGAAVDTFVSGVRGIRSLVRGKVSMKRAAAQAQREGMQGALGTSGDNALPQIADAEVRISDFGDDEALVRPSAKAAARKLENAQSEILAIDPDLDPVELRHRAQKVVDERNAAGLSDDAIEINFDRIQTTEDVDMLIREVTSLTSDSVNVERRGVRSNAVTSEAADQLGIGITDMLSRRRGEALNAEQTTAYRRVWASSAEMVESLAREARRDPSPINNFKFRKGLATFNAINQSVLGARAEAGRALQAWSIKVGGDTERAAVLGALVEQGGSNKVTAQLAENFLNAVDSGQTPGQIAAMAKRGWFARTSDAVKESAVVGLLWKPATHIGNLSSNSIRLATAVGERAVGARIGREIMTEDGVMVGEATAMMYGMMSAIRAAIRRGADYEGLVEKASASVAQTGRKMDVRMNAVSAEAFGLDESHGLGRFVETFGNIIRAPANGLEKADDFFKTVGYAGEIEAQAFRQATREGMASGWDERRIAERMSELIADPPENIRFAGGNAALYNTFTQEPGQWAKAFMDARQIFPGGVFAMPFVRTPANVLRYNFEYSPLAPFVGQWRADLAAGGARRDIALGRLAIGTAVTALTADWAWEGHTQGPLSDSRGVADTQMRSGIRPDSLQVLGRSIRVNRIDPFGLHLSAMSKLQEVLETRDVEEEDLPEVYRIMAGMSVAMSSAILDKTFLMNLSTLMDAIKDENRREAFFKNSAKMVFPASSMIDVANTLKGGDRAEVATMYDTLLEMTVVLENRLPRKRNLWGDTIPRVKKDIADPFQITKVEPTPLDEAMLKEQMNITRIRRQTSFSGVNVDFTLYPNVLDEYKVIAGQAAKAQASKIVGSRAYLKQSPGPEGGRTEMIRGIVRDHRERAQFEIMTNKRKYDSEEFKRFRDYVKREQKKSQEQQVPSIRNLTQ